MPVARDTVKYHQVYESTAALQKMYGDVWVIIFALFKTGRGHLTVLHIHSDPRSWNPAESCIPWI